MDDNYLRIRNVLSAKFAVDGPTDLVLKDIEILDVYFRR